TGFLHNEVAPQLKPGDDVFYVGDQDYSGNQIEARTRRVLEELIGGELNWKRIALTEEQVKRYRLTKFRKWKIDNRMREDNPNRRHVAVECESLGQKRVEQIVREALAALLPEPIERVHEREERQRKTMARRLNGRRR